MPRFPLPALLWLSIALSAAQAQQPADNAAPSSRTAPARAVSTVTVSVEFPGGTVATYIAALKKAAGGGAVNIVAAQQAMERPLSSISLQSVNLDTAVRAIEFASPRDGRWHISNIGADAYGVIYEPTQQRAVERGGPALEVFSIRDLTQNLPGDPAGVRLVESPQVVLTAVKTALDLSGGEQPDLKYHEDSGLLILRGSEAQIKAVAQSLDRLRENTFARRRAAQQNSNPGAVADMRAEFEKAKVMAARSRAEVSQSEESLARLKQLLENGTVAHEEFDQARAALEERRANLEMALIELRRVQSRAEGAGMNAGGDAPEEMRAPMQAAERAAAQARDLAEQLNKARAAMGPDHREVKDLEARLAEAKTQAEKAAQHARAMQQLGAPAAVIFDLSGWDQPSVEVAQAVLKAVESGMKSLKRPVLIQFNKNGTILVKGDGHTQGVVHELLVEISGGREVPVNPAGVENAKPAGQPAGQPAGK